MKESVQLGMLLADTYRIVRRIGEGGMGEVYEALHERLAGRYAVKVLHADVREHPDALARFMREAEITSGLRHPGIVQVIDFNTLPNGLPYLVMEYLEGQPLGSVIADNGPLSLRRVVGITDQLGSALTAAHRNGVVHRDLNPQNIVLVPPEGEEPERVKILDFGLSKVRSVSKRITGTAVVLGTPQYMAPEQAEGHTDQLDASSDQFSLAAIVYEMLTGRPAFSGDTLASVAYQVVHATPVSIAYYRPELHPEIENVVSKGLAKQKGDRFPSVSSFVAQFRWAANLAAQQGDGDGAEARGGASAGASAIDSSYALLANDQEEPTVRSSLPMGMANLLRSNSGSPVPSLEDGDLNRARANTRRLTTLSHQAGEVQSELRRSQMASRKRSLPTWIAVGAGVVIVAGALGFGLRQRNGGAAADVTAVPRPAVIGAGAAAPAVAPIPAVTPPAATRAAAPAPPAAAPPAAVGPGAPVAPAAAPAALARAGADDARARLRPRPTRVAARDVADHEVRDDVRGEVRGDVRGVHTQPPPSSAPAPEPSPPSLARDCRMSIGSFPWADVWVDDRDSGQHTPVVRMPIPCGAHKIELRRRDLKINHVVTVTLSPDREFKQMYQLGDFDE